MIKSRAAEIFARNGRTGLGKRTDIYSALLSTVGVFSMKRYMPYMLVFLILNSLLGMSLSGLADADKWTEKADMPTARFCLSTSVVNGKIYAIGGAGMGGNQIPLAVVEEYDPGRNRWTKKADMLTPRFWSSSSAVAGRIYAIGGLLDGSLSIVEEYNTGFAVDARGKLPALWGEIRAER